MHNIDGEIWKQIAGYEGMYEISNYGRVKSMARITPYTSKNGHPVSAMYKALIMKQYESVGYLKVDLYKNAKRKKTFVHWLVATAFIPNPQNKPCINHKKGNKKMNDTDEIEWVTYSENVKHARKVLGVRVNQYDTR